MLERYTTTHITFIPSKWAKASPIHFLHFNRFILFHSSTNFDFHSESEYYESDSPSKETNKPFNDKLWNYVLYENNKMNKYEKKIEKYLFNLSSTHFQFDCIGHLLRLRRLQIVPFKYGRTLSMNHSCVNCKWLPFDDRKTIFPLRISLFKPKFSWKREKN